MRGSPDATQPLSLMLLLLMLMLLQRAEPASFSGVGAEEAKKESTNWTGGEGMKLLEGDAYPFGGFAIHGLESAGTFTPSGNAIVQEEDERASEQLHAPDLLHVSEASFIVERHMAPLTKASQRIELVENRHQSPSQAFLEEVANDVAEHDVQAELPTFMRHKKWTPARAERALLVQRVGASSAFLEKGKAPEPGADKDGDMLDMNAIRKRCDPGVPEAEKGKKAFTRTQMRTFLRDQDVLESSLATEEVKSVVKDPQKLRALLADCKADDDEADAPSDYGDTLVPSSRQDGIPLNSIFAERIAIETGPAPGHVAGEERKEDIEELVVAAEKQVAAQTKEVEASVSKKAKLTNQGLKVKAEEEKAAAEKKLRAAEVELTRRVSQRDNFEPEVSLGFPSYDAAAQSCLDRSLNLCTLAQLQLDWDENHASLPTGLEGGCKWGFIKKPPSWKTDGLAPLAALCPLMLKQKNAFSAEKGRSYQAYCCPSKQPDTLLQKAFVKEVTVTPRITLCMQLDYNPFGLDQGVRVSLGLSGTFMKRFSFGKGQEDHKCNAFSAEVSIGVFLGFSVAGKTFGFGFSVSGSLEIQQKPSKSSSVQSRETLERKFDPDKTFCDSGGMFALIQSYVKSLTYWHIEGKYKQDVGALQKEAAATAAKFAEVIGERQAIYAHSMHKFLDTASKVQASGKHQGKILVRQVRMKAVSGPLKPRLAGVLRNLNKEELQELAEHQEFGTPQIDAMFTAFTRWAAHVGTYSAGLVHRMRDNYDNYGVDGTILGADSVHFTSIDGRYLSRLPSRIGGINSNVANFAKVLRRTTRQYEPLFWQNFAHSAALLYTRMVDDLDALFSVYFANDAKWSGNCRSLAVKHTLPYEAGAPPQRSGGVTRSQDWSGKRNSPFLTFKEANKKASDLLSMELSIRRCIENAATGKNEAVKGRRACAFIDLRDCTRKESLSGTFQSGFSELCWKKNRVEFCSRTVSDGTCAQPEEEKRAQEQDMTCKKDCEDQKLTQKKLCYAMVNCKLAPNGCKTHVSVTLTPPQLDDMKQPLTYGKHNLKGAHGKCEWYKTGDSIFSLSQGVITPALWQAQKEAVSEAWEQMSPFRNLPFASRGNFLCTASKKCKWWQLHQMQYVDINPDRSKKLKSGVTGVKSGFMGKVDDYVDFSVQPSAALMCAASHRALKIPIHHQDNGDEIVELIHAKSFTRFGQVETREEAVPAVLSKMMRASLPSLTKRLKSDVATIDDLLRQINDIVKKQTDKGLIALQKSRDSAKEAGDALGGWSEKKWCARMKEDGVLNDAFQRDRCVRLPSENGKMSQTELDEFSVSRRLESLAQQVLAFSRALSLNLAASKWNSDVSSGINDIPKDGQAFYKPDYARDNNPSWFKKGLATPFNKDFVVKCQGKSLKYNDCTYTAHDPRFKKMCVDVVNKRKKDKTLPLAQLKVKMNLVGLFDAEDKLNEKFNLQGIDNQNGRVPIQINPHQRFGPSTLPDLEKMVASKNCDHDTFMVQNTARYKPVPAGSKGITKEPGSNNEEDQTGKILLLSPTGSEKGWEDMLSLSQTEFISKWAYDTKVTEDGTPLAQYRLSRSDSDDPPESAFKYDSSESFRRSQSSRMPRKRPVAVLTGTNWNMDDEYGMWGDKPKFPWKDVNNNAEFELFLKQRIQAEKFNRDLLKYEPFQYASTLSLTAETQAPGFCTPSTALLMYTLGRSNKGSGPDGNTGLMQIPGKSWCHSFRLHPNKYKITLTYCGGDSIKFQKLCALENDEKGNGMCVGGVKKGEKQIPNLDAYPPSLKLTGVVMISTGSAGSEGWKNWNLGDEGFGDLDVDGWTDPDNGLGRTQLTGDIKTLLAGSFIKDKYIIATLHLLTVLFRRAKAYNDPDRAVNWNWYTECMNIMVIGAGHATKYAVGNSKLVVPKSGVTTKLEEAVAVGKQAKQSVLDGFGFAYAFKLNVGGSMRWPSRAVRCDMVDSLAEDAAHKADAIAKCNDIPEALKCNHPGTAASCKNKQTAVNARLGEHGSSVLFSLSAGMQAVARINTPSVNPLQLGGAPDFKVYVEAGLGIDFAPNVPTMLNTLREQAKKAADKCEDEAMPDAAFSETPKAGAAMEDKVPNDCGNWLIKAIKDKVLSVDPHYQQMQIGGGGSRHGANRRGNVEYMQSARKRFQLVTELVKKSEAGKHLPAGQHEGDAAKVWANVQHQKQLKEGVASDDVLPKAALADIVVLQWKAGEEAGEEAEEEDVLQ